PEDAEARVAAAADAGFDAIKLLGVPNRPSYVNLAEAAARHGLPVVGHLPGSVTAADAVAYHQASIEHLNGVLGPWRTSPEAGRAAAAALADPGILHVPTVTWAAIRVGAYSEEALRALDVDHTASEAQWAAWRAELPPEAPAHGTADAAIADRLAAIRALYEAGARLGIGPDASDAYGLPGVSVAEEMRWFGVAGLPNDAVLRAATQRPDGPATIAVGAPADLVVVRGDPSVDLAAAADVIGVVLSGTWWTREALADPASAPAAGPVAVPSVAPGG
ncbi:MAG: amidohydrolase family protein, partial [Myxococcota bacterium]